MWSLGGFLGGFLLLRPVSQRLFLFFEPFNEPLFVARPTPFWPFRFQFLDFGGAPLQFCATQRHIVGEAPPSTKPLALALPGRRVCIVDRAKTILIGGVTRHGIISMRLGERVAALLSALLLVLFVSAKHNSQVRNPQYP